MMNMQQTCRTPNLAVIILSTIAMLLTLVVLLVGKAYKLLRKQLKESIIKLQLIYKDRLQEKTKEFNEQLDEKNKILDEKDKIIEELITRLKDIRQNISEKDANNKPYLENKNVQRVDRFIEKQITDLESFR